MLICNVRGDDTRSDLAVHDADATVGGNSNRDLIVITGSETTVLCL